MYYAMSTASIEVQYVLSCVLGQKLSECEWKPAAQGGSEGGVTFRIMSGITSYSDRAIKALTIGKSREQLRKQIEKAQAEIMLASEHYGR